MPARLPLASDSWTRKAAVLSLVAVALSGCGSTALRGGVPVAGGSPAGAVGDGVQQSDGTTGGTGATTTGSVLSPSGSTGNGGALKGGTSGVASPLGSSSSTGGSTGSGSGAAGPVSTAPIKVGVTTANIAAIAAAFGKKPSSTSSDNPFIAYFNKHGGIAGRKIVPVYYQANSSDDASTAGQQACAAFTQDAKVDVVLDGVIGGDVLPACLQRQGVALFTAANTTQDSVALRQHPNMFQPSAMQIDRQIQALLQVSAARKALKGGDKLGVMVEDCPATTRTYDHVVVPFAKRLGVGLVKSSVKCLTNLVSDLVPISQDISRAALTFNQLGANHVMAVDSAEAFLIANFTTTASSQKYFPKYLVTSNAYPWGNSQSDATIKINPDALPNISGVGYLPLLDVGPGARPSAAQKARQADCTKADPTQLGAASETDSGKSFKQNVFFAGCDAAFVMKATIEAAGGHLGYADLARAFAALKKQGSTSASLSGGRVGGPASTLDGAGLVQPFAYDTARKTFTFVGAPVAVS